MAKRKELGKGIRALLSNVDNVENKPAKKKQLVKELSSAVIEIDINSIETNPYQPRTEFTKQQLDELSQSIKIHGVIQALTVRSLGGDKYQLISGERRLRASKMAGLKTVPAYIRVADDQGMLEMALLENIQRSDLNPIEVAISYQRLMDECDLTHGEVSERMGKNRSTVTNFVRLLKLPHSIQTAVKEKSISMGHARALVGIEDLGLQLDIFNTVLDKRLSVRALEDLIRSYDSDRAKKRAENTAKKDPFSAEIKKIQKRLSSRFGTKVNIKRTTDGSGSIVVKFDSDDELNSILDIIEQD